MSILVFVEAINNQYKKAAFEAVNYGAKLASATGGSCTVVTNGGSDAAGDLGKYGAQKVLTFESQSMFDSKYLSKVIAMAFEKVGASTLIMNDNSRGKAIAGRLAIKLNAGVVSSANAMASSEGGFKVQRSLFSGKAIGEFEISSANKILTISGNSIGVEEMGDPVAYESIDVSSIQSSVQMLETKRVEGTVPLPEAELVVSAGRGMKGPENWGIIEDLANAIGATTACSRPVADTGWRPHHEHVGQTGVAIKPNLYIAIGISGAIQHLAGVNNSKTIVVINKDPEAPFFKAADYGIVSDLFDVVPKLTEAFKKFKS